MTVSPSTTAASGALSCGTNKTRTPCSAAAIAMGSTPVTLRTVPSSASSPKKPLSTGKPDGSCSEASSTAKSTGKSYTGPVFLISAGARFTVMRLTGHEKPLFFSALRTRSFASLTALSGKPTISKAGSPPEISASTVTRNPSSAKLPQLVTCAYIAWPPFYKTLVLSS